LFTFFGCFVGLSTKLLTVLLDDGFRSGFAIRSPGQVLVGHYRIQISEPVVEYNIIDIIAHISDLLTKRLC